MQQDTIWPFARLSRMEFNSTPFDRFDPFDSIWSIWLLLYDLSAQAFIWLTFDFNLPCFMASATRHHLTICNKTPFDHLTHLLYSLSGLVEWSSIRLHLIDLIHSTHLLYWCNKTPFDHLTRLSWMEFSLSAQATRHHLTIWQGLVEWSPFDSIWSIWSIRLTCFMASQLRQQDTIWPFD